MTHSPAIPVGLTSAGVSVDGSIEELLGKCVSKRSPRDSSLDVVQFLSDPLRYPKVEGDDANIFLSLEASHVFCDCFQEYFLRSAISEDHQGGHSLPLRLAFGEDACSESTVSSISATVSTFVSGVFGIILLNVFTY